MRRETSYSFSVSLDEGRFGGDKAAVSAAALTCGEFGRAIAGVAANTKPTRPR